MQLPTCPARLSEDNRTFCELQVAPPFPFCAHHYREYCTLKETERAAGREEDALQQMIDQLLADGVEVYTTLREVQTAKEVAELYVRALERQSEAKLTLRVRFGRDDATLSQSNLDERRKRTIAFLQKLAGKERVLTAEDQARRNAAHLRTILRIAHEPFACPEGSADAHAPASPRRCPTIKLTSERCTQTPSVGQRLCMLHVMTHASISVLHRTLWNAMEAARVEVARIELDSVSPSGDATAVKYYINKVNDVVGALKQHQMTYSCRDSSEHDALVKDLRKRIVAAMLVLGELEGGQMFQIALRQGRAEVWAFEHLRKVTKGDGLVGHVAAISLTTTKTVRGLLANPWFVRST